MKRPHLPYTFCEYSHSYDERAVMLHRVAAFSTDYIRGLIIEALKPQGQMDFPEKHRNYGDGELNMSNVQKVEVLKALCSNFPFEEHLTLLKITVCSQPLFNSGMDKSRRGERKGEGKNKHFSLGWGFFTLKKQLIYIEKSADFRLPSKKG